MNWLLGFFTISNFSRGPGGGGTSQRFGWGCAAHFLGTLTLFQTKISDFPHPISDLTYFVCINVWEGFQIPNVDQTSVLRRRKLIKRKLLVITIPDPIPETNLTLFQTKRAQNHTLWHCTYLYSLYRGVPPPRSRPQKTQPTFPNLWKSFCHYSFINWGLIHSLTFHLQNITKSALTCFIKKLWSAFISKLKQVFQ